MSIALRSLALVAGLLAFTSRDAAASCPVGTFCYQQVGSPVLTVPEVYVVYWQVTSDPQGRITTMDRLLTNIGGTRWLNTVTQYYQTVSGTTSFIQNPTGIYSTGARKWVDTTNAIPAQVHWYDMQDEAYRAALHFGILDNPNALIFIVMPPGNTTTACGYHDAFVRNNHRIAFSEIAYEADVCHPSEPSADAYAAVVFHELTEAITDPWYWLMQHAWYMNSGSGEIADICEDDPLRQVPLAWSLSGTLKSAVQPLWSNAANGGAGGCVYARATHENKFARGTNGHLWRGVPNFIFGWGWSDAGNNGTSLLGDPAAVSMAPNVYDVVSRETSSTMVVGHSSNNGSSWSWTSLGSAPAGKSFSNYPDVVASHPQRLLVVQVFSDTTTLARTLGLRIRTPFGWGSWTQLSLPAGSTYSSPTAVVRGFGATVVGSDVITDVLIVIDGNLWHAAFIGSASTLTAWENLGHGAYTLSGGPDAASWDLGRLDVVVRNTSGSLIHMQCVNPTFSDSTCAGVSTWNSWGTPGVTLTSDPTIVALGDGWLHASARGTDNDYYEYDFNSTGSWDGAGIPDGGAISGIDSASW